MVLRRWGSCKQEFGFINVHTCTTNLQILTVIFLYSSSHPSHVKNSIPYSQFLRLRRLCSDDSDFSSKSEEMCQFFEKRGYPVPVAKAGHHRAQQIDQQSALQTSQKDKNDRIPFTSLFILIITQSKPSFLTTSNYFKMTPRLVKYFRNQH